MYIHIYTYIYIYICVCVHMDFTHMVRAWSLVLGFWLGRWLYIYIIWYQQNVSIYTAMYMSECLCCDGDHTKPTNFQNVQLVLKLTECVALLALRLLGVCQFCGKFVTKYTFWEAAIVYILDAIFATWLFELGILCHIQIKSSQWMTSSCFVHTEVLLGLVNLVVIACFKSSMSSLLGWIQPQTNGCRLRVTESAGGLLMLLRWMLYTRLVRGLRVFYLFESLHRFAMALSEMFVTLSWIFGHLADCLTISVW